jgi:RimJ/RimL family protein N-acetyltransferase
VNLRLVEKEDAVKLAEWISSPDFLGEYNGLAQMTKTEVEKMLESPDGSRLYFVEKKDGSKVGFIVNFHVSHAGAGVKLNEIGYSLAPAERGKGYGSEALSLLLDYMFLSIETVRIQATTDVRNKASQRILEKAGFRREGTLRRFFFIRGEWRDIYIYSILREEWGRPKVLKTTAKTRARS